MAIPRDVQHVFGKRAFKQSQQTADKTLAIPRSAPFIAEFKDKIAKARGNPALHLEEYRSDVQAQLRSARGKADANLDAVAGIEAEALERLIRAPGVRQTEELPKEAEAAVMAAYKVVTGQLTRFDGPLGDHLNSRKVESRTLAKERLSITEFAATCATVQKANGKAVKAYVRELSEERGLRNKTDHDRLGLLSVYWKWLVFQDYASEAVPNPFSGIELRKENCEDRAADRWLAIGKADIRRLQKAIEDNGIEALRVAFFIAIYSGCRIEEIASPQTSDVTWSVISIRRTKTEAGNRGIPVHPALQPLMAELLTRGDQFLFPELSEDQYGARSGPIGHQFTKIKTDLEDDRRHVFHSFRKTVATVMEQAGVSEGVPADILGHQKRTISYGVYPGGSSTEQKREAILKLDYGLT